MEGRYNGFVMIHKENTELVWCKKVLSYHTQSKKTRIHFGWNLFNLVKQILIAKEKINIVLIICGKERKMGAHMDMDHPAFLGMRKFAHPQIPLQSLIGTLKT